ncbi:CHAD domain-containing protein [Oxalobacteraceae bacterium CAVE-383]|nr:CHAD domain-containing protein [Oxalobacteraceae bacterium CAVE-383]
MRTESKATNGDANTRQAPPSGQAVKAAPEKLSKRMTVEQAYQEILRNCLNQIQANRDVVANKKDIESLHQMRVGLRRLDSALDLFGDFFSLPKKIRQDLDWLGEQLGAARDWDVLRESTLPYIADAVGDTSRLSRIEAAAAEKSVERHNAVATAVTSAKYARLMQDFNYWLQSCGWRDALPEKTPRPLTARIPDLAHDLLSHAQRRLCKRGKRLPDATPKARHKVRIAAKKARYAAEFFESLLAKKAARRYIKTISGLQDELGRLNDMSVADHLLKDLTRQRADLLESTSFIRGYLAAYTESEAGNIQSLWKKFSQSRLPH